MAKHRRDSVKNSRRNPSRSIKIQDRDEILKRVMDERNGRTAKKSRSSEIREQVYNRKDSMRQPSRRRSEKTELPENKKKQKKHNGVGLKGLKNTPGLNGVLLLPDKKNSVKQTTGGRGSEERKVWRALSRLVSMVVFFAVVIYAIISSVKYMQKKSIVANDTVTYGSIQSGKMCSGVIVRDEVLYNAPAAGEAVFNVADLDKVKANTEVCAVQDTEAVENMQAELDKTNEKILEMQKTRESISAVSDEVKQYNSQIKASADNYAFRLTNGDIGELYSMKNDVQKIIDTRNQRLLSENSGSLSNLAAQRAEQQNRIVNSKSAVVTADEGVVSCYSDGLESNYTVENMGDLKESDISVKANGAALGKIVKEGEPVFKIVRSNDWYIVSYIPNNLIENWVVGDKTNVYLSGDNGDTRTLEVQIASINAGDKKSLCILKSTKYLVDFINTRTINFETNKVLMGYKIPNDAIVEQTMLKVAKEFVINDKVYKKTADDTLVELSVVPAGQNEDEGLVYIPFDINRLNVGETLAMPNDKTKTFTISDVVTVKGVFVMNTGIAEFCRINLENSSSNANYTVLDPSVNTSIKIADRIVTDTLNIEKQQKLIS